MLRPILFNTEMVRAILAGRKTETRRLANRTNAFGLILKPYEEGDVLYVRETWHFWPCNDCGKEREACDHAIVFKGEEGCFSYRAEWEDPKLSGVYKWKPSIHMPKEAARLFLRVTEVRCQNLQDITDAEARAEGVGDSNVIYTNGALTCMFAELWDSTVQKGRLARDGWAANPRVWVFRFECGERPDGRPE